ncbi:hypothetical protein ABW21_db0201474 [Orbilia brochopaga]|nr:hypothetical protein ABW21_db0201474 [Drechslerella brochopaga]
MPSRQSTGAKPPPRSNALANADTPSKPQPSRGANTTASSARTAQADRRRRRRKPRTQVSSSESSSSSSDDDSDDSSSGEEESASDKGGEKAGAKLGKSSIALEAESDSNDAASPSASSSSDENEQEEEEEEVEEEARPAKRTRIQPAKPAPTAKGPPSIPPELRSLASQTTERQFEEYYMKKLTEEFGDDLNAVRQSKDFTARSVPMLVRAMKGGVKGFDDSEMQGVIGGGTA